MRYPGLLVVLAVVAGGCGGGGAGGGGVENQALGCDEAEPAGTTHIVQCIDYENVPSDSVAQAEQECTINHRRWLGGPCDHTGAVGGCRVQPGSGWIPHVPQVYWWWPGFSATVYDRASAKAICADFHGAFLEP